MYRMNEDRVLEIADKVKILFGADRGRVGVIIQIHDTRGPLPYVVRFASNEYASFDSDQLESV